MIVGKRQQSSLLAKHMIQVVSAPLHFSFSVQGLGELRLLDLTLPLCFFQFGDTFALRGIIRSDTNSHAICMQNTTEGRIALWEKALITTDGAIPMLNSIPL